MIELEIISRINEALKDPNLKTAVTKATNTSVLKRNLVVEKEENWSELVDKASEIKKYVIDNFAGLLAKTEKKLAENGVDVLWASDCTEAADLVTNILKEYSVKTVVKAKSMVTEEIHLNTRLEKEGIQVFETDLGEHIVQIAGETPSHITAPALHKTKRDIALLFQKIHSIEYTENAEELTDFARHYLREKFFTAEAGISGANFICADNGTIVLVENEGNIRFSITTPDIHIIIAGIEKLLPSFKYTGLFLRLLAPSATGQKFPTYVSFITPDKLNAKTNKKVFLIFLDNGRTDILKDEKLKDTLKCIRCGACMNVCPVYKRVSGHAYHTTYPGPIGSLISPYFDGEKNSGDLAFASSLCGRCGEVCPVKINLPHLLPVMRDKYNSQVGKKSERTIINLFSFVTTHPFIYSFSVNCARFFARFVNINKYIKGYNKERTLPPFGNKRFKELFKENNDFKR